MKINRCGKIDKLQIFGVFSSIDLGMQGRDCCRVDPTTSIMVKSTLLKVIPFLLTVSNATFQFRVFDSLFVRWSFLGL